MNVAEWLKNKVLRFLKVDKLPENPNSERLLYINNNEDIIKNRIRECKIWYYGEANEILNFYTQRETMGQAKNPIYNRNERNYFWGLSSVECDIKRVHTGIPHAVTSTVVNAIGYPTSIVVNNDKAISTDAIARDKELNDKLQHILEYNDFKNKYNQQQMPLTLAVGYGAWKPIVDPDFAKHPIWQFYDAENVDFIEKYGKIVGVIFKDYYKDDKGRDYVKFETRRITADGASVIEHDLFRIQKGNELLPADYTEIPGMGPLDPIIIPDLNRVLAVPCRFFFDPLNPKGGRSIYTGKIDLFDMIDEIWSQLSQTNRVSTPVEYYSTDVLVTTSKGVPVLPNRYNRQFVAKQGIPNGDGVTGNKDIETTQPQLNFSQYVEAYKATLDAILIGMLSPATMGIDVAKKDNADAQREKEKVTLMFCNNVMDSEEKILKEVCELSLMLQEYIDTGKITVQDYDVTVKFQDIATPSFNQNLSILGSARQAGNLSNEMYVNLLWGDTLSDEEKQEEIKRLEEHDSADNYNLGGMFPQEPVNEQPETTINEDLSTETEE